MLEIIFIIIISILVMCTVFNILTISYQKTVINRYHKMIEKILLDQDIIESSKWTLATKYNISEKDIDRFLVEKCSKGGDSES